MGGGGGPPAGDQQSALPTGGADPRGKIPVIIAAAQKYGVDPATAIRVARSEGLAEFLGDGGKSGGAFQLYTGGGLGNEFQKATGHSPLDPKYEDEAIDWAMRNVARTGWGPYKGAAKVGIGPRQGIGVQTAAAATPQPDQQTASAAGGAAAPSAPVGTSPVAAPDEEAQPAAVEQPEGSTGQHPFIAPSGNAAGPANIQKGAAQAQQPTQVAQAAPPTASPPSNDVLTRYTQAADSLQKQAAQTRDTVRRQGLAAAGSGLTIPARNMKAQLDQADKQDAQAAEYRKIVNDQRSSNLDSASPDRSKFRKRMLNAARNNLAA